MARYTVESAATRRLATLLVCVCLLPACKNDDTVVSGRVFSVRSTPDAWVATEPTQCLTNPWEQDWLEQHGGDYDGYPKDPTWPRRLTPEEIAIIQDYYSRQGVVVFEATARQVFEGVCLACDCPEGHTLYLLVRDEDVATMIGLGYREELPLK